MDLNIFFLLIIAILCFGTQMGLTTFYFNIPHEWYGKLYILTWMAAGLKVVLYLTGGAFGSLSYPKSQVSEGDVEGTLKDKLQKNRDIILSIPAALVFFLAFPSEHYRFQQFLAPLIIGCVGIRISRIFLASFIPTTLVIVIMILAALGGGIDSMAYFVGNLRSCLGSTYPTDLGTIVLFIALFMWVLFRSLPDELFLIPAALSFLLSKNITRSITSKYLSLLFILILLFRIAVRLFSKYKEKFYTKAIERETQSSKEYRVEIQRDIIKNILSKISKFIMSSAFPVFGMIMLFLVYAYFKQKGWASSANSLMHRRLIYPARMLEEYGIHPFGTYFELIGYGGSTVESFEEYNFIDSTYAQLLIRHGWVTYIVANILWVYTTLRAVRSGNKRLAVAMTVMAIDFIMEHHWYELSYNPFILIAFSDFSYDKWENCKLFRVFKERWKEKKYVYSFAVITSFQTVLCILVLPRVLSWMRTIFNGFGLYGGGWKGVIVFMAIAILLFLTALIVWGVSCIAAEWRTERIVHKLNLATLIMGVVCFSMFVIGGHFAIERISRENTDRIESEREILELALNHKSGKFYVDKLPEAYMKYISGISTSYLHSHDYARYKDATVLVDADWDSDCMAGKGFLYLQISDEDALYTNDPGVIEVLKDAGYVLRGYNSCKHIIDLDYMAELNDLKVTEEGLMLEGKYHQLTKGPGIELVSGKYTAEFELELKEKSQNSDKKICSIRVESYAGEKVKAKANITEGDFDEDGKLSYKMIFYGYGQDYEFKILTEEGVSCLVSGISYSRTPDTDTHILLDDQGRTIREEYYDPDGTPQKMAKGNYGTEYEYGNNGLRTHIRYLGRDLKPASISAGYAEIHREYDIDRQLIQESYFGTDGEPVNRPTGQHSVKRGYDSAGNVIEESYYDTDDEPVLYDGEYYKVIREYDEEKRCISEEYYGTDDELMTCTSGNVAVDKEYDDDGNLIKQVFIGEDLEPMSINLLR